MRGTTCTLLTLAILAVALPAAWGDVPSLVNYQGRLEDSSGDPITTTVTVLFAIWNDPTAGDSLWSEQRDITPDADGLFDVLLGSLSPIPDTAFSSADAYLGIKISTDPEISPRTRLVTVPYSYRVSTVDGSTGGTVSGDVSIASDLTVSGKATIGPAHTNTGSYAFVAGYNHTASANSATIGGGEGNTASGVYATVGGGSDNTASYEYATVGGGSDNEASASNATVGGGEGNTASYWCATVGGGFGNSASLMHATVPGGALCVASGFCSFAAGRQAKALHDGSFVWGDNTGLDVASETTNQFKIRASNGVRLASEAGADKAISMGDRYRDNGIVAWARVSAGGASGDFGVTSVVHDSLGCYTITVDASATSAGDLVPVAIAEIDAPPWDPVSVRIVAINQVAANSFHVYIVNGMHMRTDNDFVFMVTGR